MTAYNIANADVREWIAAYEGDLFHAALFDPPYHLYETAKRFSSPTAKAPKANTPFARAAKGFMGQTWDGGGLMFMPETWDILATVLHPGAFGMAFASARTVHRMAVAIEDAGLILHPTIFCWVYGSGFARGTRIDSQVDKALGIEQPKDVNHPYAARRPNPPIGIASTGVGAGANVGLPVSPMAQTWAKHRYGQLALRPSVEPILLFQKPYPHKIKPVESITESGAGALWVEGARLGSDDTLKSRNGGLRNGGFMTGHEGYQRKGKSAYTDKTDYVADVGGRLPSNVILSHSPFCTDTECVDDCPVQQIGEQSGWSPGDTRFDYVPPKGRSKTGVFGDFSDNPIVQPAYPDSGTAARYFFNADFMLDRLEETAAMQYVSKASTGERNAGLEANSQEQIRLTYDASVRAKRGNDSGYARGNTHPTVKPLSLAQHLATLLLPPAEYAPRRLFNPFSGSGSEIIGAALAGWEYVQGVEMTGAYIEIAESRLQWWLQQQNNRDPYKPTVMPDGSIQYSLFSEDIP